jgi:type I restriction enzyme S subunit
VGIGDFVISLRSFQGGIEYAYYQGIISPAYTILTPQNSSFAGYLKYLLKSYDFISLLKLCVTGIREGQNIDYSKLRDFKIPIPPQEEQTQIVRFLDWKISEINKLIALYKNQIERLEELKRTVVSRAVTRGLNYDVKMKDSGVGWIGEIPEHWGVTKVKRKCKLTGSGTTPTTGNSDFYNGDIAWIQSGDLYHTAFVERTEKSLTELALQEYSVLAVYTPPFLVIAMYGASIGNASISYISACVNQACCVLIPTDDMDIRFMRYWLEFCKNDFIRQSEGGTQPNISQKKVREEIIVVIPKEEQRLIADYLESKNSQINAAIENKKQQIQRIQELRTRLISDVVTGKIDVRGIQIPEYGFVAESINEEIDEAGCEEQEDEYE